MFNNKSFGDRSTFADFCHRHGKDDRFRGVEKTRERESLFNEFIIEVRRREKEERESQREKVHHHCPRASCFSLFLGGWRSWVEKS